MAKRDADKALDVIGKKIATKEKIDQEFNIYEYQNAVMQFEDKPSNMLTPHVSPTDENNYSVTFSINKPYFGFNVISNLTLGRAFELVHNDERDNYDYNISPDARRALYADTEKFKMNEKWLRFILQKVADGKNSILVLDDVFTQVTTGNYDKILPYKEQLAYIASILEEYPEALYKTVALVRGPVAKKIISDGGPDLMAMLAQRLNYSSRLVDGEGEILIKVKDPRVPNGLIKIRSFNPSGQGRKNFHRTADEFIQNNPGYDIYYNSSMRNNLFMMGITASVDNGMIKDKPCGIICFGPTSEYNYYNVTRPQIEEYDVNRWWYKIAYEPRIINGEQTYVVIPHWEDYVFPHNEKQDTIDYLSIVGSDLVAEVINDVANLHFDNINKLIDQKIVPSSRRALNKVSKKHKLIAKAEENKKKPVPAKYEKKKSLLPSYQEKIVPKENKHTSQAKLDLEQEK